MMSMKAPESVLFDGKLASRPGYVDSAGWEGWQTAKSEGHQGVGFPDRSRRVQGENPVHGGPGRLAVVQTAPADDTAKQPWNQ
jgi:hypothetical protein